MRDYQPVKNNKFWVPDTVWNIVLWTIRDYDRMKYSPRHSREIGVICDCMDMVPDEYFLPVWHSIRYGKPFPNSCRKICSKWKCKIIHDVAEKMGYV